MQIAIYPRKGTKKHLCHWHLPAAEVLCFFLYSILQVGSCACRDRLCDRQRLDALRDVPLQGADLMQVVGDLSQGLFNALGIQRQNAIAQQAQVTAAGVIDLVAVLHHALVEQGSLLQLRADGRVDGILPPVSSLLLVRRKSVVQISFNFPFCNNANQQKWKWNSGYTHGLPSFCF